MAIIRGTTPTVRFTFATVSVSSIEVAILSIKQNNKTVIERGIDTATVGSNYLEWKLTQTETLTLGKTSNVFLICDWKLDDGTRGRSNIAIEKVESSGVNEVI